MRSENTRDGLQALYVLFSRVRSENTRGGLQALYVLFSRVRSENTRGGLQVLYVLFSRVRSENAAPTVSVCCRREQVGARGVAVGGGAAVGRHASVRRHCPLPAVGAHCRSLRRNVSTPPTGRKEMFYLTTHSTHFSYGYMA